MNLVASPPVSLSAVRDYWNIHIHDLEIAQHPVGSPDFFRELDEYRFDKLRYLPHAVDFTAYEGQGVLEVGCGAGIDLARFAAGGARVTGIDLAPMAKELAEQNFEQRNLRGRFYVMNGEEMDFSDGRFDMVYAHGVLQYTPDPAKMVREIHRVLRPGGEAILMVYNKHSWLPLLSRLMAVQLEHEDAPVFRLYSIDDFRKLLHPFATFRIIPERFPVPTRLHRGLKAALYNQAFVRFFNLLPRTLIRRFGWHLLAFAEKKR